MKDIYFVILNSEGDTTVEALEKEELEERLSEGGYYGNIGFIEDMIVDTDTNYWGGKMLIIKGEIAVPKPKKIVEAWELE